MKKRAVRALALLLCILMCVSLLPLTALAADAPAEKASIRFAVSSGKPRITTQPKSKSVMQGKKVTFKVAARGSNLKYQWYYRKGAGKSWKKYSGKTRPTLSFTAGRVNGYQYRCKVSSGSASVYSRTVTLKVNYVKYRALLIGQVYENTTATTLVGDTDVAYMQEMLKSVKGPMGVSYKISTRIDASREEILTAIASSFSGADDNDVSLFYFSGHGVANVPDGDYAGAMCTVEPDGSIDYLTMPELADRLKAIPGKVIVMIDSCGSGAAIYSNGVPVRSSSDLVRFNRQVVSAFAAADRVMEANDGITSNLGDFRKSKFYVLTASRHMELSSVAQLSDGTSVSVFTYLVSAGVYYGEADLNSNAYVTLSELYKFVKANEMPEVFEQHVQVYPSAKSSYKLFKLK